MQPCPRPEANDTIQYVGDLVSDSEVDRGSSSELEAEVEEVVDFMEEEAWQHRQMVADGTEEVNTMADHLVAEGRANVAYEEVDLENQPPLDEYVTPPLYSPSNASVSGSS